MWNPNCNYPALQTTAQQQCPTGTAMFTPGFTSGCNFNNSFMTHPSTCNAPASGLVRKTKRYRTAYTTDQVLQLEQEYKKSRYIGAMRRKQLAASIKITDRNIKLWFQNRRMKEKRDRIETSQSSNSSYDEATTNWPTYIPMQNTTNQSMNEQFRHNHVSISLAPSECQGSGDHLMDHCVNNNVNTYPAVQPVALDLAMFEDPTFPGIESLLPEIQVPEQYTQNLLELPLAPHLEQQTTTSFPATNNSSSEQQQYKKPADKDPFTLIDELFSLEDFL